MLVIARERTHSQGNYVHKYRPGKFTSLVYSPPAGWGPGSTPGPLGDGSTASVLCEAPGGCGSRAGEAEIWSRSLLACHHQHLSCAPKESSGVEG